MLTGEAHERMIAKRLLDEVEEHRRAMLRGMGRGCDDEIVEETERAPLMASAGEH